MPREYTKDKIPPPYLYSRRYQRKLGRIANSIKQRKIPPSVDLLALRKEMTVSEIAAKFLCTRQCVYEWIRRAKDKK